MNHSYFKWFHYVEHDATPRRRYTRSNRDHFHRNIFPPVFAMNRMEVESEEQIAI